jgi:spoIIIJ-associated protein
MEWVETTGRSVEEAKEAALDELGVDEADAEFEIVAEPRAGLFGRLRSEARVRARVRPTAPRAKEDRRDRRRRSAPGQAAGAGQPGQPQESKPQPSTAKRAGGRDARSKAVPAAAAAADDGQDASAVSPAKAAGRGRQTRGPGRGDGSEGQRPERRPDRIDNEQREGAGVEVALEEQGKIAEEFLAQLTSEFGLVASVASTKVDDETLDIQMTGSDLGLLIGPKGATLLAIQNLARTVVHYETGANNGHINVDVGGYRRKRTEALIKFAQQVASTVQQSGSRTALEPMSAVDRKVVHDALGEIDGVSTVSEGEEPRRRVVVVPSPTNG